MSESFLGFESLLNQAKSSQVKQLHITNYGKKKQICFYYVSIFFMYALKSLSQPKFRDEEHAIFLLNVRTNHIGKDLKSLWQIALIKVNKSGPSH